MAIHKAQIDPRQPEHTFDDSELHLRVYRNIRGFELAAYGYDGFWKSPSGFSEGRATFPALRVLGASARGTLGKGILNLEIGHYEARDDADGRDPEQPNSEWRFLIGYEREVGRDLTLRTQIYVERLEDHDAYLSSLPDGMPAREEYRDVFTLRLQKLAMSQNLTLTAFTYLSAADEDGTLRASAAYKLTDAWLLTTGTNQFWGNAPHTFFGQFEDADNVYAGARFSF